MNKNHRHIYVNFPFLCDTQRMQERIKKKNDSKYQGVLVSFPIAKNKKHFQIERSQLYERTIMKLFFLDLFIEANQQTIWLRLLKRMYCAFLCIAIKFKFYPILC